MNNGHNSNEQLRSIVERIERLTEEKQSIADDIKDVFAEAKSNGYDVAVLKTIIKERKQDRNKLAEKEAIADTYRMALGMISDLPLGQAAIERAVA